MRAATVLLATALVVLAAPALAAEQSGCVGCHTDEGRLKALFTPPKPGPSEGEG